MFVRFGRRLRFGLQWAFAGALAAGSISTVSAQTAGKTLPVFETAAITNADPSTWAIAIIKQQKLDEKHGFELRYKLKPVSVAYTDFVNGADPVCLCLTIGTGARFLIEGVDVALGWTYNSYSDAYLITEKPEIKTAADLPGHTLAGSTGSGSWIFQQYFLKEHQGVDLSKVKIPSIVASAQVTNLVAQRVDAITGYDATKIQLERLQPGRFRFIETFDKAKWKAATGIDYVPMFLLGLRASWYDKPGNSELLRKFYAAYSEAVAYVFANPKKAASEIGEERGHAPVAFIASYLEQYPESGKPTLSRDYRNAVRKLTQEILPPTGLIIRSLTDSEVQRFVLDFNP